MCVIVIVLGDRLLTRISLEIIEIDRNSQVLDMSMGMGARPR